MKYTSQTSLPFSPAIGGVDLVSWGTYKTLAVCESSEITGSIVASSIGIAVSLGLEGYTQIIPYVIRNVD